MKDTSIIPKGHYCYDENGNCPYWSLDETKPYQLNGYCSYLEKGDWQLEEEKELIDCKTGKKVRAIDLPFPCSLLWDQCKECEIN